MTILQNTLDDIKLYNLNEFNDKELIKILNAIKSIQNIDNLYNIFDKKNEKVKIALLKTIARLNICNDDKIQKIILNKQENSNVRREAVSVIGRQRDKKNIDFLLLLLKDSDPNIVLQAIRALIIFKNIEIVKQNLLKLKNHKNEIIREVIEKEFYKKNNVSKTPHYQSYDILKNVVVNGDVLNILKEIPEESFHLTFTSPPYYNARDYSIYQSYDEYLNFLNSVFKEIHRTTKEGRFFILNTSPIIIPRVSRQHSSKRYPIPYDLHNIIVNNGWEFIDDIVWIKPEASVKNRIGGFMQHRKPLAYKPNSRTEMLMVYRKKTDKLLDWNIKQYPKNIVEESKVYEDFETSNVWKIDPTFDKKHSAVFPIELCNRVIKYYSFKNDLVFDPFGGSGTLAKSALLNSRYFFTTEIQKDYYLRMQENLKPNNLFIINKPITFMTYENFKEKMKNDINRTSS